MRRRRYSKELSRGRFSRKRVLFGVNLGFAIILLVFITNLAKLYENTRQLDYNQGVADELIRFSMAMERLVSSLESAESAQQNFFLSGDHNQLDQFNDSIENTKVAMLEFERRKPSSDDLSPDHISSLLAHTASRVEQLEGHIQTFRVDGETAALELIRSDQNQETRAAFKGALNTVREPTRDVMDTQKSQVQRDQVAANAAFLGAAVLNLLLVISGFVMVRRYIERQEFENWIKSGEAELNSAMNSKQSLADFANSTLGLLSSYLDGQRGVFYLHYSGELIKVGSFAAGPVSTHLNSVPLAIDDFPKVALDSSLAGEVIKMNDTIHIREIGLSPGNNNTISPITLGIGEWLPSEVILFPIFFDGEITGVVELARFGKFTKAHRTFIKQIQYDIGRSLDNVVKRSEISTLLIEKTRRAEELQMQQEELRASNEELEDQARALSEVKKRLQLQQEELEQTNIELEQQTRVLEEQKRALKARNEELTKAKGEIERKAQEVERGSQFKSEFLANMSHELRTPLNSILIMSTLLTENQRNNLSSTEVDYANTIHKSGSDLLHLINDILDLSKVEAGQLKVYPAKEYINSIVDGIHQVFEPIARQNNLGFNVEIEAGLDLLITTDRQRLEQILNNFLSNAFKFTERGHVTLKVESLTDPELIRSLQSPEEEAISFHIIDTGIGIEQNDVEQIFEAFRQVDGSIRRKHGGTGLGLAICRQLANLLHGNVTVESRPGYGSQFSLHIPRHITELELEKLVQPEPAALAESLSIETPLRQQRVHRFREILIVEDDESFAATMAKVAEEFQLKTQQIHNGRGVLEYLARYIPEAIILDINLPGIDGLSILNTIKQDDELEKVPIHVISGFDYKEKALDLGAVSFQKKPVSIAEVRETIGELDSEIGAQRKRILLIEDQPEQRQSVIGLLQSDIVIIDEASTGKEALLKLREKTYDCIILDLNLPDLSGFEVLDELESGSLANEPIPPIIIYTAKDLSNAEQDRLRGKFSNVIVKGSRSSERLLDEVELFIHQIGDHGRSNPSSMPTEQTRSGASRELLMNSDEKVFSGRRVLVVDDDMRNVFALASVLENKGMIVDIARNGQEAIEAVCDPSKIPAIEIVLMDIMMPVMDGYEAIKHLRCDSQFQDLPIIALTAKAMKGDRDRCINAGATDYLAKPIELSQLFSLLRVWLTRTHDEKPSLSERL